MGNEYTNMGSLLCDEKTDVFPLPDVVQFDDIRVIERLEDLDLVHEGLIVPHLALLNSFDCIFVTCTRELLSIANLGRLPVLRCSALYTTPKPPEPIRSMKRYSSLIFD